MNALPLSVALCLALAPAALGGTISLSGGLGTGSWGLPATLPINGTFTQSFARTVPGLGSISGDVVITNTSGTRFDLTVTNTTFQMIGAGPGALTHLTLTVTQAFVPQTPNAPYNAAHSLNGSWDPLGSNNAMTATATQGLLGPNLIFLPQLVCVNNPNPTAAFGAGPAGATVNNSSPALYGMQCVLDFYVDGNGFIDLPNSYDATAIEVVPAPGAGVLLAGGVLVGARGRRRD